MEGWVECLKGQGYRNENDGVSRRLQTFKKNSVGYVESRKEGFVTVVLAANEEMWDVPENEVRRIDVRKTGNKSRRKICNICHRILPIGRFARNQVNKHGIVRRPSCKACRTDIDKRAPKSQQAKRKEKERPAKGELFRCPICDKRSIAGVTAKIVADHDHHTGNIRGFICDSCNTGLGRFKNGQDFLQNAINYIAEHDTCDAD